MKIMNILPVIVAGVLTVTACVSSCNSSNDTAPGVDSVAERENYSDLPLFELKGNVKECSRTTFYHVTMSPEGEAVIDSAGGFKTTLLRFDKRNHYVKKENERIKRDSLGRIVRWEDHRPNAKGVSGGFLRDTLNYDYSNPYVVIAKGMGEITTTTRDSAGNILGQISTPLERGTITSALNVPLEIDRNGNWTRRLTVWTDRAAGEAPRVFYTLDTRNISYY